MQPADAVLFDLDGVLVDSRLAFAWSVNAALRANDLPERPEADLHGLLGPPLHSTFKRLAGDDPALVASCVDAYRERYRACSGSETTVCEGILELLDALRDLPLVVATSKPAALAEPLLHALGLREHFRAAVGPTLDAENEPKAMTLGLALELLPNAQRPVMVGDRDHDIAAARAHDLDSIGVLWGTGTRRELEDAGATAIVATTSQLHDLLAGLDDEPPILR